MTEVLAYRTLGSVQPFCFIVSTTASEYLFTFFIIVDAVFIPSNFQFPPPESYILQCEILRVVCHTNPFFTSFINQ